MFAKPSKSKLNTNNSTSSMIPSDKQKLQTQSSPLRVAHRKNQMSCSMRNNNDSISGTEIQSMGQLLLSSGGGATSSGGYLGMSNSFYLEKRIQKLEDQVSSLQHQCDQLSPVLGLKDQGALLGKFDGQLKKLVKKQLETDEKTNQYGNSISQLTRTIDTIKNFYLNNFNNTTAANVSATNTSVFSSNQNLKNTPVQTYKSNNNNSTLNTILESESSINQLVNAQAQRISDRFSVTIAELKEELQAKDEELYRELEEFKSRQIVEQQTMNQTLQHLQSNSMIMRRAKSEDISAISEFTKYADGCISEQFAALREQCEKEFLRILRDIGAIQVRQELSLEFRRKEKASSAFFVTENLDKFERLLKINNIEQGILIEEAETFNKENCQRLVNELRSLEEKIDSKSERVLNQRRWSSGVLSVSNEQVDKEVIQTIHQQLNALKYQIEGTQEVYRHEMRRIKDKMENIDAIRGKISNDPNEKKDLQRFTQDVKKAISFADKISRLTEQIDQNMKIVAEFQRKVEDKLSLLSEQVFPP